MRAALALLLALPACPYYHYIHYSGRSGGVLSIPEKFDLNALPNRTVAFYVSESGPAQYAVNDSFGTVLAQIRQAAATWNAVETSELRVALGGLATLGGNNQTPAGEIVFDELPPGVLGYGGPTARADVNGGPAGAYVPITRAVVRLNRDLTRRPGPSSSDAFFFTVLHEMGHALGLQHTFTSATMSTAPTRATTRTRPLEADDIAAISLLYPGRAFLAGHGAITGRVTSGGAGVHLASVVAIRASGPAISALTHPDGTYRLEGLPPDAYWVYVHAVPSTADLVLPVDPSHQPVPASPPFETVFYPGTRDPQQFGVVTVGRGTLAAGIDFAVQTRPAGRIYDISTYSFVGQAAVSPAFLNTTAANPAVVARGAGITVGDSAAPGLTVQVLGAPGNLPIRAYGAPQTSLAIYPSLAGGSGPRHLLFSLPNELYVLPNAFTVVQKGPPAIGGLLTNPEGAVQIIGANLGPDSRVYFDGTPGAPRLPFSGNEVLGTLAVTAPPGAAGQRVNVTVHNADGQGTLSPFPYNYETGDAPLAAVSPATLPAGASAMVEISSPNMRFVEGLTTLGFGTTDVSVRRVWVVAPNRALANVMVSPTAHTGPVPVSVISGFQVYAQAFGLQIVAADPRSPAILLPLVNAGPSQSGLFPGASVSMFGSALATLGGATTLTLNDERVPVLLATPGVVSFVIPASLPVGPAVLRLHNGSEAALPVVLQIEAAPPAVLGALNSGNQFVTPSNPAAPGDSVTLIVNGLDASVAADPSRLRVIQNGVRLQVVSVSPGPSGSHFVTVALASFLGGPQVQLAVSVEGGAAALISVSVRVI